jgi:hypothetical protein
LLHKPDVLRLRRTVGHDLYLVASQAFVTVPHPSRAGEYKVKTLAYSYVLAADEDIHHEFVTWQWHPDSTHKLPHAHVHWPCAYWYKDVNKLHLPTGRVSLELLAGFLIESLDVKPGREDWRDVLDDSLTRFETYRSWA